MQQHFNLITYYYKYENFYLILTIRGRKQIIIDIIPNRVSAKACITNDLLMLFY